MGSIGIQRLLNGLTIGYYPALQGDLVGAQLVMDCGVPLVRLPCAGVVTHLHSTIPEIDAYVKGRGAIGNFLAMRFREYAPAGYEVGFGLGCIVALNHRSSALIPDSLRESVLLFLKRQCD
jgi:hypothetical protein